MSKIYKILATDYYDGAIEGFLLHKTNSVSYFRLVAWDSDQDQRLFVVADVDAKEMFRLENLLKTVKQSSQQHVWLPEWAFSDSHDATEANKIIERCRKKLVEDGNFVLGNRLDTAKEISRITRDNWRAVEEEINGNVVGNLDKWLTEILHR